MPKQKLSDQVRERFCTLQFCDIFVKMAERIEALEKQQKFLARYGIAVGVEVETVEASQEILALRQRVKELEADAKIGKMVRNMRSRSRLVKSCTEYWSQAMDHAYSWHRHSRFSYPDPIIALQAIQKVERKP